MLETYECINCGWTGQPDELVCTPDDDDNFSYCPRCEQGEFDVHEEEDDE